MHTHAYTMMGVGVWIYVHVCVCVCSGGDRPYDLAPKAKAGATGMTQHVWYWRVREKMG